MRIAVLFGVLLVLAPLALAAQSFEPVVTRTVAYTASNRTYTFSCYPGPGLDNVRHWAVRPDVTQATFEYQSTSPFLTYVLNENVMYHISCGAMNGTKFVQSDYHIDRRLQRQPDKPYITVSWSDGTRFAARCQPPVNVTNYALHWWTNNYVDRLSRADIDGQTNVNTTVPYPGLWEIVCGTWDNDRSQWSQISYTVEFFATGQAYTPSVTGCIPGEPCPWANGTSPPPPPPPPPPNTTNTTNTTQPTNQSCFTSVFTMPATCTGGTITSSVVSGCRTIVCNGTGTSLKIMACNKPGNTNPQYFEMYRQAGSGQAKICIGATCLQGSAGYVKSPNFPICVGNATVPPPPPPPNTTGNQTNTTQPPNSTGNSSVSLAVAPWYPQGRNYVFHCNAQGFTPSAYDWIFGDGQTQNGKATKDVYHSYTPGSYNVRCTARNAQTSRTGTLAISVT